MVTNQEIILKNSRKVVSPILYYFVRWVIHEAQFQNATHLFFMARDGFLLYKIACKICTDLNIPLQCKYLYCSRRSLYLPTFHLIGNDTFDYLFAPSSCYCLRSVFVKAGMDDLQVAQVLQELNIKANNLNQFFSDETSRTFRNLLEHCPLFLKILQDNSRHAYQEVVAYFRQEGLFDQKTIVLVDSGWSGSSQHAIRIISRAAGYQGTVQGLYFGLLSSLKSPDDGIAKAWYFDSTHHCVNKALFSPTLFECILSADHGPTIGYIASSSSKAEPLLGPSPPRDILQMIAVQHEGILSGAFSFAPTSLNCWLARQRFRWFFFCPRGRDAEIYGRFLCCDDSSSAYQIPLITKEQITISKEWSIWKRLQYRLRLKVPPATTRPFWLFGCISLIRNPLKRNWYRINALILELYSYSSKTN